MTGRRDSPERIDELVALYKRTRYDVVLADGGTASLRVGEPAEPPLADWMSPSDFALYLSACNPCSQALPPARNEARMAALRRTLRAAGARWLEGSAGIPGETWRESSLLVAGLALGEADLIAARFGQNAGIRVPAAGRCVLRVYRDDWRSHAGTVTDIEWSDS